jgi:hypothetical protein
MRYEAERGRGGNNHLFLELALNGIEEKKLRTVFYEAIDGDADKKRQAYFRARKWALTSGLIDDRAGRDRPKHLGEGMGHRPMEFFTFDELAAVFAYDAATGALRRCDGRDLTVQHTDGYLHVCHAGRRMKAHRVAWLLATGAWPQHEIDHINGDRSDNRIANLRDVTHRVNQSNQKRHRSSDRGAENCDKTAVDPGQNVVTPRARAPLLTEGMSLCHCDRTSDTKSDSDSVLRDTTVGLEAAALESGGRTRTAELCLVAARSVMAEVAVGRSVDPLRVQWAEQMLACNTTSRARGDEAA